MAICSVFFNKIIIFVINNVVEQSIINKCLVYIFKFLKEDSSSERLV